MDFNLDNMAQFNLMRNGGEIKPCEPGPGGFDPAAMFTKRRGGSEPCISGFSPVNSPDIQNFNQSDVDELESFCKSRGIIGVNFGKMNPRQILNMLKNKTGIPNESIQPQRKTLLNG